MNKDRLAKMKNNVSKLTLMKSSGSFLRWLEKKSTSYLTVNQLWDFSKFVSERKLPKNEKIAVVWCNKRYKKMVRKNKYLRMMREIGYHCYQIYSDIIPFDMLGEKRHGYFIMTKDLDSHRFHHNIIPVKNFKYYSVKKIISGGQTGADQGGLVAGHYINIYTGGTAPANYRTDYGNNIKLKSFGLNQSIKPTYPERTEDNVIDSDGTIIFGNTDSAGGRLTISLCIKHNKPVWTIDNKTLDKMLHADKEVRDEYLHQIRLWIVYYKIQILNIAGNRESTNTGIQKKVFLFIVNLLSRSSKKKLSASEWYDYNVDELITIDTKEILEQSMLKKILHEEGKKEKIKERKNNKLKERLRAENDN